jgi:hypothetical protein
MRGWVEIVENAVRHHEIDATSLDGPRQSPMRMWPSRTAPVYRLTEGGWNAINRTHGWIVSTWLLTLISLVVSIAALLWHEK